MKLIDEVDVWLDILLDHNGIALVQYPGAWAK